MCVRVCVGVAVCVCVIRHAEGCTGDGYQHFALNFNGYACVSEDTTTQRKETMRIKQRRDAWSNGRGLVGGGRPSLVTPNAHGVGRDDPDLFCSATCGVRRSSRKRKHP